MKDHEDIMVFYETTCLQPKTRGIRKPKRWRQNKCTFLEDGCSDKDSLQTKTGYNRQILHIRYICGTIISDTKALKLMESYLHTQTKAILY